MDFTLQRFPHTSSLNLKAWNAADELLLATIPQQSEGIMIVLDAYGYLTHHLINRKPIVVTDLKSQDFAIRQNLKTNGLDDQKVSMTRLTQPIDKTVNHALLKVPKSVDLFELSLQFIHRHLSSDGMVYCGFMTKYFSRALMETAEKYFESVEQTRAHKKARVMILSKKKDIQYQPLIHEIDYKAERLKQYYGVFSSTKIDMATRFLLEHIQLPEQIETVLDLAAGNGIIAKILQGRYPNLQYHVLDDSHLAIESCKMNLNSEKTVFHHHYNLSDFEDHALDVVVTNPPFHFGHTIDISIPLNMFKDALRILKPGGHLFIVANSNLGYHTHLRKWFKQVDIIQSNHKFHIFDCLK